MPETRAEKLVLLFTGAKNPGCVGSLVVVTLTVEFTLGSEGMTVVLGLDVTEVVLGEAVELVIFVLVEVFVVLLGELAVVEFDVVFEVVLGELVAVEFVVLGVIVEVEFVVFEVILGELVLVFEELVVLVVLLLSCKLNKIVGGTSVAMVLFALLSVMLKAKVFESPMLALFQAWKYWKLTEGLPAPATRNLKQ